MAEVTPLGNVILFLQKMGIYEVVIPFLLIFTLVFAILERTRALGTEKIEGQDVPRKNLNAIVAFSIAFLVIASSKLVETITMISSQMVVVLTLLVFFMVLIGIVTKEGEAHELLKGRPQQVFLVIVAIAIIALFLNALKGPGGRTWLEITVGWISQFWSSTAVAAVILMIGVIIFIWFMTKTKTEEEGK
jgi:predicted membrane channel-forming protein YqfA (hemolysin III family)